MTNHEQRWQKARRQYLKDHPPNHEGYYVCAYCFRWVLAAEITVDHIIPRSAAPHLRYEPSNFALACGPCNAGKGSRRRYGLQLEDAAPFPE